MPEVCSVFFFSSRRRHTRSLRDWSSDVCSSDLLGNATCPGGSLNPPDADTADQVVQLWNGGSTVQNLRCPATAVALSATRLAALVSECGQSGSEHDGDRKSVV